MNSIRNGISVASLVFAASLMIFCGLSLGEILINEVEFSPPYEDSMWVELYNNGDQAIDISNWNVSIISKPWIGPIHIPDGTEISPRGFYIAEGDSRWDAVFNASVLLTDGQGIKMDKTPELSDTDQNDFTLGRIVDGRNTDTRRDWAWMPGTKGRSNSITRTG